jgi:hypothetical protein
MSPPIALIIFNRPEKTKLVFKEIAKCKPSKLFIIADGPRNDHPEDIEKCAKTRKIVNNVDWDCEVFKNYSETNLGCGIRPATGISWVFEHVDKAIILEDDCLPTATFFNFCDELLERYKNDQRIMMIGGTNTLSEKTPVEYSYFFAKLPVCWGWATWRRAWRHHDMGMKLWPLLRDKNWFFDIMGDSSAADFWWNVFNKAYEEKGNVDYWDFQWAFACWMQNGLVILPKSNLISNIGCDNEATHTKNPKSYYSEIPTIEIDFPLTHPPFVVPDREIDRIRFEQPLGEISRQKPKLRTVILNMLPDWLANFLRRNKSRFLPRSMK